MASTTRAASATSASVAAPRRRALAAAASAALMRSFSTSLANTLPMSASALATASGRVSYSLTVWPATAATWAMPAPMAPLPTTATILSVLSALIAHFPWNCGARLAMKAATPSR